MVVLFCRGSFSFDQLLSGSQLGRSIMLGSRGRMEELL